MQTNNQSPVQRVLDTSNERIGNLAQHVLTDSEIILEHDPNNSYAQEGLLVAESVIRDPIEIKEDDVRRLVIDHVFMGVIGMVDHVAATIIVAGGAYLGITDHSSIPLIATGVAATTMAIEVLALVSGPISLIYSKKNWEAIYGCHFRMHKSNGIDDTVADFLAIKAVKDYVVMAYSPWTGNISPEMTLDPRIFKLAQINFGYKLDKFMNKVNRILRRESGKSNPIPTINNEEEGYIASYRSVIDRLTHVPALGLFIKAIQAFVPKDLGSRYGHIDDNAKH